MMFGGQDLTFETSAPVTSEAIQGIILELWPEAVFETSESEAVEGEELFAYRDAAAQESWNEYGLTDDNGDALLYIIINGCHIHVVHDDDALARRFADRL